MPLPILYQNTWIIAYLDDLVGVAEPDKAQAAFLTLSNFLQALGLSVNSKKVEAPSHKSKSIQSLVH